MNDPSKGTLSDSLALTVALMHGGKVAEGCMDGALAPTGQTFIQWWALRAIVLQEGLLPLGQLASRIGCVKSNVTQMVDRLEAEGILKRTPDSQDRRSILVEPTERGRQRYQEGHEAIEKACERMLAGLQAENRTDLGELLKRIS